MAVLGSTVATNFTTGEVLNGGPPAPALTPTGILLRSDDPEYLLAGVEGRTYQDRVAGRLRVFDYHVNRTDRTAAGAAAPPRRLYVGVAVTAPMDGPVLDVFHNRRAAAVGGAPGGPSYASVAVGALARWLASPEVDTYVGSLRPGESLYFEQEVEAGDVAVAMYDLEAVDGRGQARPVLITTYASGTPRPPNPSDPRALRTLPSTHVPPRRGTFPYNTLVGSYAPPGVRPVVLPMGEPHGGTGEGAPLRGEYRPGRDALEDRVVWNAGNYGVLYRWLLRIPASVGGPPVNVLLNPRGGDAQFAVRARGGALLRSPVLRATTESWVIDSEDAGGAFTLEYSLPGATAAPVWLAFRRQL